MEDTDFRTQWQNCQKESGGFCLREAKTAGVILKSKRIAGIKTQIFRHLQSLQNQDLISIAGEAANSIIYTYCF